MKPAACRATFAAALKATLNVKCASKRANFGVCQFAAASSKKSWMRYYILVASCKQGRVYRARLLDTVDNQMDRCAWQHSDTYNVLNNAASTHSLGDQVIGHRSKGQGSLKGDEPRQPKQWKKSGFSSQDPWGELPCQGAVAPTKGAGARRKNSRSWVHCVFVGVPASFGGYTAWLMVCRFAKVA